MSRKHVIKASVYDKRGNLIGEAFNSYVKSHPLQAHFAKLAGKPDAVYLHAEIAALLKCGEKKPHSIFIERYSMDGRPALAAPCKICMRAIKHFGIQQITYTV